MSIVPMRKAHYDQHLRKMNFGLEIRCRESGYLAGRHLIGQPIHKGFEETKKAADEAAADSLSHEGIGGRPH